MKKSERTKAHIVKSVAPVFNKKGFAGTSLSDLTKATGLTKGGLYGNFPTKEDIAVAAFRYAVQKIREEVRKAVQKKQTTVEQLLAFLEYYRQYVVHPPVAGGCLLLNMAVEADDNQPVIRKEVAAELQCSIEFVAEVLDHAVKQRELRSDLDTMNIAYNIFCAIEGAIMMSRVQNDMTPINKVVDYWKLQIESWKL